jgi:hypothetical protein
MASLEKELLDYLYLHSEIKSVSDFQGLRWIIEGLRKMNIQKSTILIEKDLIEFIKKNSGLSLDSLYTQFNEINKETLHACLRQLIDDSKISYKNQLFY